MKSFQASKKMKKTKAGMILVDWEVARLEDVAHIQTGIAKNQNKIQDTQDTVELPYLRVANVQDGYLDLSEIKTISIHKDKVNRYKLEVGDVLLTEGGDFDKLGRGAVWEGQIANCVHQNHVFAVRPSNKIVLSSFYLHKPEVFMVKNIF